MGLSALSAYRGDLVQARAATALQHPMIMSATSLIRMEDVCTACPNTWFQAYMPAPPKIPALVDRVRPPGSRRSSSRWTCPCSPIRENNIRAGFSTPLRPSLRLFWDGITHPRGRSAPSCARSRATVCPYFENSQAERGAPIIARNVDRDFTARDAFNWAGARQGPPPLEGAASFSRA
jgi:L-lactate dehydrogenase (cytochrome)